MILQGCRPKDICGRMSGEHSGYRYINKIKKEEALLTESPFFAYALTKFKCFAINYLSTGLIFQQFEYTNEVF